MLISAVSIYALALLSYFLFAKVEESGQGGMLILIPPAGLVIAILMGMAAGLYGIVCGGVLSAFTNFASASTSNLLKTSAISGLGLPLVVLALKFADSFERPNSQSLSELGLTLLVLWAIGTIANLITLWLVGRMFRPEPTLR